MPTVTPERPILLIVGTNRPGSRASIIAKLLARDYRAASVPVEVFSMIDLPADLFSPLAYASKPPEFAPVQRRVLDAAGLHLVVPEYNGGYPGVLKLFIDHLKFPDSFEAKPACFTGEAAGMFGALRPVEQLQQIFAYRNAYIYPRRVFIPHVDEALDDAQELRDPALAARLREQAIGFARFVDRVLA